MKKKKEDKEEAEFIRLIRNFFIAAGVGIIWCIIYWWFMHVLDKGVNPPLWLRVPVVLLLGLPAFLIIFIMLPFGPHTFGEGMVTLFFLSWVIYPLFSILIYYIYRRIKKRNKKQVSRKKLKAGK